MHHKQLNYHSNNTLLFNQLAKLSYAIWLDSSNKSRYDIISACPSRLLTTHGNLTTVINDQQEALITDEDPLSLAKSWLDGQKSSPITQTLPFSTGVMGYLGYDLGYRLLGITPRKKTELRLPDAVIGYYPWSIVVDHELQSTQLISELPLDHPDTIRILKLLKESAKHYEPFELSAEFSVNMTQQQYTQSIQKIKQHLTAGDCYQVNFSQCFSAPFTGSPWQAYQQLRQQTQTPMSAFMHLPYGDLLSFSPERFLKIKQNGQVITQPIKGTRPRYQDKTQDDAAKQALINSEKDRAENLMIVDLMRNDLGKCCQPGSIEVPNLFDIKSFNNVHHLVSTITAQLENDQHALDLLKHCFPGGSITGAPKHRVMQIIDSLEPQHRSVYCGSFFYCDNQGKLDSNIAIRTLMCNQGKIYCSSGGGIVIDSSAEEEYQESCVKVKNLLNALSRLQVHEVMG